MRCTEMVFSLRQTRALCGVVTAGMLLAGGAGCRNFIDQSDVTRGPTGSRLVVPILSSIDPIDEGDVEFQGATEVRPEDLDVAATDYIIARNDLVTVSIFDLINQGVESVRTGRVTETGNLTLPMLNEPVRAAGLTETQLQKAVAAAYRDAGLIQNAQVTATVVEARGRTFNIMGSVARPGQYAILEADFRVLNALVQAGDTTFPVEYLYVIRKLNQEPATTQPADPATPQSPNPPTTGPADLAPKSDAAWSVQPVFGMQQPGAAEPVDGQYIYVDGKPVLVGATQPARQPDAASPDAPTPAPVSDRVLPPAAQPPYEFGADLKGTTDQRVIKVPLAQLKSGDLRYNIVIRPGDFIIVPPPQTGFYYMGGHVGQPGVFALSGYRVTLKQAVISARNLDPLAVPQRTDVIRRIGGDREVFVRVDLDKIAQGLQPDIFLKPNDVVMVGTDWWPPFLQAIRGSFRFTYGFGFIYDRNFAYDKNEQTR